jgi:tRNA dimethylallyltransferase
MTDNFLLNIYKKHNLITVLGPTAVGKTTFAAHLAKCLNAEVISADSRQVYRKMDLGTGKDIDDYTIDGYKVPYHLIDIVDAGKKYNLFQYQKDFFSTYEVLNSKNIIPVLCGGTGLYLDAIIRNYKLQEVPANTELRKQLEDKSLKELSEILKSHKELHNVTEIDTKKRAIRAIEIEIYNKENKIVENFFPKIRSLNVGIKYDRATIKNRISTRLTERLEKGMILEVENLIKEGVSTETLIYYGLEYKYITLYLLKVMSFQEMSKKLEISIHQFSKRQMTWFRKMEREGVEILWIDGYLNIKDKISQLIDKIEKAG